MPRCKKCRKWFVKITNLNIHKLKHKVRFLKRELLYIKSINK